MGNITKKELSQLYYLQREIRSDERRLQRLVDAATSITSKLSGSPGGGSISDKTAIASDIADLKNIISSKRAMCVAYYNKIMRYIASIDDSMIRLIITYRHIDMMKWRDIAQKIGGGNSEDSVRKAYARYLGKDKSED